jgi:hypothetical protein
MPLITKKIWVEGKDGKQELRTYWERERPVNPYAKEGGTGTQKKKQKVRRMARRKTGPDERGYSWSMGYNNCVGRYTGEVKYSRFTGSSLNREPKQLNIFIDGHYLSPNLSKLPAGTANSVRLAIAAAKKLLRSGLPVPEAIRNFLVLQSADNQREFECWLSGTKDRAIVGLGIPIHMLSPRSRGKIKDKATAFFRASAGDRIFVTLTFIAAVDDHTGVAILNKFLTAVRKEFPKLQYLWVAERQTENIEYPYNIHFHIILNKRLPVGRWNAMWVLQQYNCGLEGRNEYGETVTKQEIIELYKLDVLEDFKGAIGRTGKRISRIQKVFNPMDAKKVKSINGLSMYLTKYITKQKKGEPFSCAVWHCSRKVSRLFTRAAVGPSAFAYMMSLDNCRLDTDTGECWMPAQVKPKKPGDNFFIMVYANNKAAPLRYLRELEQINKWQLAGAVEIDKLPEMDDELYRKLLCKN